jgi:hypothetical protein
VNAGDSLDAANATALAKHSDRSVLFLNAQFVHFCSLLLLNNVLHYSKWKVKQKRKKNEEAHERGPAQSP